ncbi:MAG: hypothetical protein ABSE62_01610 [Chthoniobacteraceae bacterium]
MRTRPWIIAALMALPQLRAQDDLPQRAPGVPADFPPKLMLEGPGAASPTPSAEDEVTRLETALLQARQRAAKSDELYQEGVLAKVEVEERTLLVIQITRQLADARLVVAQAQADAVKKSFDSNHAGKSDFDAANAALKAAQDTDTADTAQLQKAEMDAAELDLQRKRKLYFEGAATRREVEMAEDRVTLLTGTSGN